MTLKTINKKIIKEVFDTYNEPKFRIQFNKAEKMMKSLLNQALELKEKEVLEVIDELDDKHLKFYFDGLKKKEDKQAYIQGWLDALEELKARINGK